MKDKDKKDKEIESLNKQIEEYQKALDETTSEKIELENIIKEVREYIKDKYAVLLADDMFLNHDEEIDRNRLLHILEILKGER